VLDGELVNACLVAASQVDGSTITTVEGLEKADGVLSPVQRCFLEHGGSHATEAAVREAIAGNLCRCTGYSKIVSSIQAAALEKQA
jgi:carbon-monoxide dehydrogenase small subunit